MPPLTRINIVRLDRTGSQKRYLTITPGPAVSHTPSGAGTTNTEDREAASARTRARTRSRRRWGGRVRTPDRARAPDTSRRAATSVWEVAQPYCRCASNAAASGGSSRPSTWEAARSCRAWAVRSSVIGHPWGHDDNTKDACRSDCGVPVNPRLLEAGLPGADLRPALGQTRDPGSPSPGRCGNRTAVRARTRPATGPHRG